MRLIIRNIFISYLIFVSYARPGHILGPFFFVLLCFKNKFEVILHILGRLEIFFGLHLFIRSKETVSFIICSVAPSFMVSGNRIIYRKTFPLQDLRVFSTSELTNLLLITM